MQSQRSGGAAADPLGRIKPALSTNNLHLVYANDQADEFRRDVDVDVDPSGVFWFEERLWHARHRERRTSESGEPDRLVCVEQATDWPSTSRAEATPEDHRLRARLKFEAPDEA